MPDKKASPRLSRPPGSGPTKHASYPVEQYLKHIDKNPAVVTQKGTDPKTKSQDMANHLSKWEDHWQSMTNKDNIGRGPKL